MKKNYLLLLLALFALCANAAIIEPYTDELEKKGCNQTSKYLYWTGEENDDFFNEQNWRIAHQKPTKRGKDEKPGKPSCLPGANKEDYQICIGEHSLEKDKTPKEGVLEPGKGIPYNLLIQNASPRANAIIKFKCDAKGITLINSELHLGANPVNGVFSLNQESTVYFKNEVPSFKKLRINLLDSKSWVYFYKNNPAKLIENALASIYIENAPGIYKENFRLDQYYQKGTVLRRKNLDYTALKAYAGRNFSGKDIGFSEDIIYRGSNIPEGMNDQTSSFILKRGYQATFSVKENGTSMSKVYIASEKDLKISDLPLALQNNISFVRVLPWEWITKKGTGGYYNDLDAGWYYNWGNGSEPEPNYSYVPMTWGAGSTSPNVLKSIIAKAGVNHLLGFNESDNCEDQSGQYNNLCDPKVAVAYYENLMGTGLRLGTPAPREGGPFSWLSDFNEIAKNRNVRFDFVAVHWYDWGSSPANSPNEDASEIFNRFKNYLNSVHKKYNLPIWITEFNANPNRGIAIQEAFLRLALPYLEQLDYVERYAFFPPNPNNAKASVEPTKYKDAQGNLTNIGRLYLNHESSPSIPELTYEAPNNLEGLDQNFEEKDPTIISFEAECSPYLGNQFNIIEDDKASNSYYLQLDTSRQGETNLAKQIQFDFTLQEADSFRIWLRYKVVDGSRQSVVVNIDESDNPERLRRLERTQFGWEQLPRYYDLKTGDHRITIQIPSEGLFFDAIALINDSGSVDLLPQAAETCVPPEERWGGKTTDVIYWAEGENPDVLGADWTIGSSEKAYNGQAIYSTENSIDSPPSNLGFAIYNFEIAESDRYKIWGKIQALSADNDSFWYKIDDGEFKKWENLSNDTFLWYWKEFYNTVGANERKLSFFLEAGNHTLTVAYREAGTKLDRLAIASYDKNPALEDPNVLSPDATFDYEAEDAVLLGNAEIVGCAQSSNGQQVNLGRYAGDIVKFDNVSVIESGIYLLQVSYMSAVSRSFGLVVNGTALPDQTVISSGDWCYQGGATAIHELDINLNAGTNIIEITGSGNNAPFVDKISLSLKAATAPTAWEAEDAEILGNAVILDCGTASNGQYVNLKDGSNNAVSFENVSVSKAGAFVLNIDYISANNRELIYSINTGEEQTVILPSSGEWCYNGGAPATFQLDVNLQSGKNKILLKSTGKNAPFIDKISVSPKAPTDWEAEDAEILGNAIILDCGTASNGQYVNLKDGSNNAVSFENVSVSKAGAFVLSIDYISANNRELIYAINAGEEQKVILPSSGEWCYNGGAPATFQLDVNLQSGKNKILLKSTGNKAPFIDRIGIDPKVESAELLPESGIPLEKSTGEPEADIILYPNPIKAGEAFTLRCTDFEGTVDAIYVHGLNGNQRYAVFNLKTMNNEVSINPVLGSGIYIVKVEFNGKSISKKIIVN